jgi:putative ubiquitin-RnfH superfamily antitoxin RatB of RatAB toxin-antitoxin module
MAPADADESPLPSAAPCIAVELVHSPRAGQIEQRMLTLPAGATVGEALRAGGPAAPVPELRIAVWGRLLAPGEVDTTVLRDRDRVELLRPLQVDPKEARRRREQSHREAGHLRGSAKRRPKPGV